MTVITTIDEPAAAPAHSEAETQNDHENPTGLASLEHTVPNHWGLILALYLAGIFMGALDMGIVNPARTVIQNSLGVDDQAGVWVFTIYTLAYAIAIPVIGKLADVLGRKPVYVLAIALFGIGSLGCGLAQDFQSFGLLLASRVIQAVGGGGMMPVATAAAGVIAPPAKRGMALGLVGMVYGVASVIGGSAGSLIMDIAGTDNWQWIFYINVPIALAVVVLGALFLDRERAEAGRHLDIPGTVLIVVAITALLWMFQHLDFTDLGFSFQDSNVRVSLLIFAIAGIVFWVTEHRVHDPLINFDYFANIPVGVTLLLGMVAGALMMTVMFIPQFAENSMRLSTGDGGYPTIIIGLASGIAAPISGRLTDKLGPRFVLGLGMLISAISGLLLIFWTSPYPGFLSTSVSIFVMGFGLGFLMGAPLTYLILHLVPSRDANTGQATLSLTRSLATTLAPAIMVGLLATAMGGLSEKVMDVLPKPDMSALSSTMAAAPDGMPGVGNQSSQGQMPPSAGQDSSKNQTSTGNPRGDTQSSVPPRDTINPNFSMSNLPDKLLNRLQSADVTNIVARSKELANYTFASQSNAMKKRLGFVPPALEQARQDYLQDIDAHADTIESTFQLELNRGFIRLFWFYTLVSLFGVLLLFGVPSKKTLDAHIMKTAKTAAKNSLRG
ncbi:MFS transporter [Mobiluncus curtisii]|uniref:MFS transporter n=1 Tax=Mobiluncus curtisii TaxID=2051 RepID=UPI0014701D2D|nr:MFS transporter [Mobiluncus curtisii]NMW44920.1 MFS transporter [Mobiluncus curtisii]NMW88460.1 MFS transporter [Mobiluncus curtisii]